MFGRAVMVWISADWDICGFPAKEKQKNRIRKKKKKLLERFILYSARTEANRKHLWTQFKNIIVAASDLSRKTFFMKSWEAGDLWEFRSLNCYFSNVLWGGVGQWQIQIRKMQGNLPSHCEASLTLSKHKSHRGQQDDPEAINPMG